MNIKSKSVINTSDMKCSENLTPRKLNEQDENINIPLRYDLPIANSCLRPINIDNKPNILWERSENIYDSNFLRKRSKYPVHKGLYNTPEPMIPPEDCLLDPDFEALRSYRSIKPIHLSDLYDREGIKENISEYIPFEMEKDEFNPESNPDRNLELEKREFPSFHSFHSEDYRLEEKLYSQEDSFPL